MPSQGLLKIVPTKSDVREYWKWGTLRASSPPQKHWRDWQSCQNQFYLNCGIWSKVYNNQGNASSTQKWLQPGGLGPSEGPGSGERQWAPFSEKCGCLCGSSGGAHTKDLALFLVTWNSFKAEKQLHREFVKWTHCCLGKGISVVGNRWHPKILRTESWGMKYLKE